MKTIPSMVLAILLLCSMVPLSAQIDNGKIHLINSNTDTRVLELQSGNNVIDLDTYGTALDLEVVPNTSYAKVRFVAPGLRTHTESVPPYAFFIDQSGDFYGWNGNPGAGTYEHTSPLPQPGDSFNFTIQYLDGSSNVLDIDTFTLSFSGSGSGINNGSAGLHNNLYDTSGWTVGTGNDGSFARYGPVNENVRELGVDGHGNNSVLWVSKPSGDSGQDGGIYAPFKNIDASKSYMMAVWLKKTNSANGNSYFGFHAHNNSSNHSSYTFAKAANNNPYFWWGDLPSLNKWYLLVAYVHPFSYSGPSLAAMYDGDTGAKVSANINDMRFGTDTKILRFRSLLYKDTNAGDRLYHWAPSMFKVDGSEPSLEQLLGHRSGSGDTQAPSVPTGVTNSNVGTNTARITWNPSTDDSGQVAGYKVFNGTQELGDVNGTSIDLAGLSPNTAYSIKVTAYDGVPNHSAPSTATTFTTQSTTVAVTGVTLDRATLQLGAGQSGNLIATVLPTNASNKNLSWSSNATGVASVDSNGRVTATGTGTAIITVTTQDGGKVATAQVTVNDDITASDSVWSKNGNNVYYDDGNVGIATSTPGAIFHINSGADVGRGQTPAFMIGPRDKFHIAIDGNEIGAFNNNTNATLHINASGSTSNTLINADGTGKVGIGTSNPSQKLEVNGDIGLFRANKIKFLSAVGGDERAYIRSTNGEPMAGVSGDYNSLVFATGGSNEHMIITGADGKVGIGTLNPDAKLAVNGRIHTQEVKVDLDNWPDYVFEEDYDLPTLEEVRNYIYKNGRLPKMPSAEKVHSNGVELGEMNRLLLEKIEELTMYILEQDDTIKNQRVLLEDQMKVIEKVVQKLNELEAHQQK